MLTITTEDAMDSKSPDVWHLVFEQTPPVLRWVLGVLTLGVFTLAGVLYRLNRESMNQVHKRVDRLEVRMTDQNIETNRLLLQIAQNTHRSSHPGDYDVQEGSH